MKYVIGVDPGLSGAIAVYDTSAKALLWVKDLPLIPQIAPRKGQNPYKKASTRREIDAYHLATTIDSIAKETLLAVVEDVSAMTYTNKRGEKRGQGAAASFTFGRVHGQVLGILACCMIPISLVRPAVWKSLMNLSSDKELSRRRATELFPWNGHEFRRKKDDGRAEAALLSYFGAQRLVKKG